MLDLFKVMEQVKLIALAIGRMQRENISRKDLEIQIKSTSIDLVTEIDKIGTVDYGVYKKALSWPLNIE